MATQTTANQPLVNKTFYERTLLDRLLPTLVWMKHGQKKPIPKNEGDTVDFRRFNSLPVITTPLVEGVTPAGTDPTISHVTAVIQGYGDYIVVSDKLDMVGIDPVITEWLEAQGEQAGESLDTIIRNVVVAGTNALFVGGGPLRANVGAAHLLTGTTVRTARKIMARNNIKRISGDYIGLIHPDGAHDIMGDPAWVNANQYSGSKNIFEGELGKLHGIRFIESTLCPIWAGQGNGGIDVYGTIILGQGGYGVPDIAGSSKPEVIVKPLGSGGSSDPLNQRSTIAWKAYLAAVRLQELAILRIEHAVSV